MFSKSEIESMSLVQGGTVAVVALVFEYHYIVCFIWCIINPPLLHSVRVTLFSSEGTSASIMSHLCHWWFEHHFMEILVSVRSIDIQEISGFSLNALDELPVLLGIPGFLSFVFVFVFCCSHFSLCRRNVSCCLGSQQLVSMTTVVRQELYCSHREIETHNSGIWLLIVSSRTNSSGSNPLSASEPPTQRQGSHAGSEVKT